MIRKSKKTRFTYHTSIGNHPQPPQASRYLSSCYSAARGRIQIANSFHTTTQPFPTSGDLSVSEVTPNWLEDPNIPVDSELSQEQPEELDPKYMAYRENQVDSDDEDEDENENGEGDKESGKRKRTAGVSQARQKLCISAERPA